jgi:streptogramin lyase
MNRAGKEWPIAPANYCLTLTFGRSNAVLRFRLESIRYEEVPMRVSSAYLGTGVLAGILATAIAGCGDDQPAMSAADGDLASVTLELGIAPTDARCAVITATPQTGAAVVRSITLVPQQPTVFTLTGLPLGIVTFTQQVFTIACSMVTATTPPTWITDPVTVTLAAGLQVDLSFALRRVDGGGQVTIHDDFPASANQISFVNVGILSLNLATGPDGNIWFTDLSLQGTVNRVSVSGSLTRFPVNATALIDDITAGPDGNLWVTERAAQPAIGRITTSGVVTEFPLPSNADPVSIASGPDGNLWFADRMPSRIGRITPFGAVTFFNTLTANARPFGISAGPDGNVWFTEEATGRIGRITPTGAITEFSTPTVNSGPSAITTGPDGNLWFTEIARIGRITPTGAITEFTVPPTGTYNGITAGPDGNVWFVSQSLTTINRITPAGVITAFETGLPGLPNFFGIATGPDANLWVAAGNFTSLTRLKP